MELSSSFFKNQKIPLLSFQGLYSPILVIMILVKKILVYAFLISRFLPDSI